MAGCCCSLVRLAVVKNIEYCAGLVGNFLYSVLSDSCGTFIIFWSFSSWNTECVFKESFSFCGCLHSSHVDVA